MVAGIDRFLLNETGKSNDGRAQFWKRDFSSADNYSKSLEPNRKHLAHILGVRDERVKFEAPELVAAVNRPGHTILTRQNLRDCVRGFHVQFEPGVLSCEDQSRQSRRV